MDLLFPLDPKLTYLNHASFGAPTIASLERAEAERRRIETDTATALGPDLHERLRAQAAEVTGLLNARTGALALTRNSTEANAAVSQSVRLTSKDHVVLLDVEYQSVIDGWRRRAADTGAEFHLAHLPLPATAKSILAALDATPATVLIVSAITSSTALLMPLPEISAWAAGRGVTLIVDAAHAAGHIELDFAALNPAAAFGSLHKWLPVPRSVGFLWLRDDTGEQTERVRPATESLTSHAADPVERFGWPGTWDPAAALGLADAIDENEAWRAAGAARAGGEPCRGNPGSAAMVFRADRVPGADPAEASRVPRLRCHRRQAPGEAAHSRDPRMGRA